MYDPNVFEIIRQLQPSARGEYEITDVNNEYIRRKELAFEILDGLWTDAGTFESLLYANQFLMETQATPAAGTEPRLVSEEQISDMIKEFEGKIQELKKYRHRG